MIKNFVIWSGFYALSGIVLTSVITESLNKSTYPGNQVVLTGEIRSPECYLSHVTP